MKYEVKFKLANEGMISSVNFQENPYHDIIVKAIDNFNETGESARNFKKIFNYSILSNLLIIRFESNVALENPTKSFRFFSKFLIDTSSEFSNLVIGGRLLKGVDSRELSDEDENIISLENKIISDEDMITTLIHWCMSKEVISIEEKKNRKQIIEKIKQLILEGSIIK